MDSSSAAEEGGEGASSAQNHRGDGPTSSLRSVSMDQEQRAVCNEEGGEGGQRQGMEAGGGIGSSGDGAQSEAVSLFPLFANGPPITLCHTNHNYIGHKT